MSDDKVYNVILRSEKGSQYDTLFCKLCNKTCMRANFSDHKRTVKHKKYLEENNQNQNQELNKKITFKKARSNNITSELM